MCVYALERPSLTSIAHMLSRCIKYAQLSLLVQVSFDFRQLFRIHKACFNQNLSCVTLEKLALTIKLSQITSPKWLKDLSGLRMAHLEPRWYKVICYEEINIWQFKNGIA